eukprot:1448730-Prorocentrum_lima.AAC.1
MQASGHKWDGAVCDWKQFLQYSLVSLSLAAHSSFNVDSGATGNQWIAWKTPQGMRHQLSLIHI